MVAALFCTTQLLLLYLHLLRKQEKVIGNLQMDFYSIKALLKDLQICICLAIFSYIKLYTQSMIHRSQLKYDDQSLKPLLSQHFFAILCLAYYHNYILKRNLVVLIALQCIFFFLPWGRNSRVKILNKGTIFYLPMNLAVLNV